MGYAFDITIPANTSESEPKEQKLKLHTGVITRIECKFPLGCSGMVKVRLSRGGVFQLFPLSPDEWVTGDDEPVGYDYYYEMTEPPSVLIFRGCSPNTTFSHKVTIRITVLPKSFATFKPLYDLLVKIASRIFGVSP